VLFMTVSLIFIKYMLGELLMYMRMYNSLMLYGLLCVVFFFHTVC